LPSGRLIEDGIPYDEKQTTSTLTSSCNLLNVFAAVFPVLTFGLAVHRSFGAGRDQPVVVVQSTRHSQNCPCVHALSHIWMAERVEIHTTGVSIPRGLLGGLSALHMQALLE
jgi:hypothetical protein